MDWTIASSILSTILSILAFGFSIITYLQLQREKKNTEKRQFLEDSMSLANRWAAELYTFMTKMEEVIEHPEKLDELIKDSYNLLPRSRRWHNEKFYRDIDTLLQSLAGFGLALADFPKHKCTADDLVEATTKALTAVQNYVTIANTILKGERNAIFK